MIYAAQVVVNIIYVCVGLCAVIGVHSMHEWWVEKEREERFKKATRGLSMDRMDNYDGSF